MVLVLGEGDIEEHWEDVNIGTSQIQDGWTWKLMHDAIATPKAEV